MDPLSFDTAETSPPELRGGVTPPPAGTVPKRRGRPPGATNKPPGGSTLPPLESVSEGAAKRPRGRPRTMQVLDTPSMARQLAGLHLIAAKVSGFPELALSDAEAFLLAESVAGVMREYDLSIDGKTGAAIQLLGACAIIYVPRLVALQQRRQTMARSAPDLRVVPSEPPAAA